MTALFALLLLWGQGASPAQADSDRDGLTDGLESALARQFLPAFHLTEGECDGRPAAFAPDSRVPVAKSKDGTIHVRVFPVRGETGAARRAEIHYFHLWAKDCGRGGHPLDVERVAALVEENERGEWRALYWYASAHEDTVCDAGHGARAPAVYAEKRGPRVWISRGKHASYLSLLLCAKGCGGDTCDPFTPMKVAAVVNIGEPGAWQNGAVWVESPKWPFVSKMKRDFEDSVLAQFEAAKRDEVIPISAAPGAVKAAIYGGDATIDALDTANKHTGAALDKAGTSTDSALTKASNSTGSALKKSAGAVANSLKKSTKAVGDAVGVKPK